MKVIATLQAEGNSPTEVTWANNTDAIGAIQCVTQLVEHDRDQSPWTPRVIDIRIVF